MRLSENNCGASRSRSEHDAALQQLSYRTVGVAQDGRQSRGLGIGWDSAPRRNGKLAVRRPRDSVEGKRIDRFAVCKQIDVLLEAMADDDAQGGGAGIVVGGGGGTGMQWGPSPWASQSVSAPAAERSVAGPRRAGNSAEISSSGPAGHALASGSDGTAVVAAVWSAARLGTSA